MAFIYDNTGKIIFLQNFVSMKTLIIFNDYNITMQSLSIIVLNKMNSVLYDSPKVESTGLCMKK